MERRYSAGATQTFFTGKKCTFVVQPSAALAQMPHIVVDVPAMAFFNYLCNNSIKNVMKKNIALDSETKDFIILIKIAMLSGQENVDFLALNWRD